eukprot:UN07810
MVYEYTVDSYYSRIYSSIVLLHHYYIFINYKVNYLKILMVMIGKPCMHYYYKLLLNHRSIIYHYLCCLSFILMCLPTIPQPLLFDLTGPNGSSFPFLATLLAAKSKNPSQQQLTSHVAIKLPILCWRLLETHVL